MKKLIYLPLPRYQSRYTEYVSGATGTFAACVADYGNVELDIISPDNDLRKIGTGVIQDTMEQTDWGFFQTRELIRRIMAGEITSDSLVHVEDFWHPGMGMIPYACDIMGIKPKVYALLHAQSVDPNDFTYPMRSWMRGFERGWASWLTGIFVSTKELRDMVLSPDWGKPICDNGNKVHVVGLPYHRKTVMEMFPPPARTGDKRNNTVIFSSRLDPEKQPEFFISVAKAYAVAYPEDNLDFRFVSGRKIPTEWHRKAAGAVTIWEDTPKQDYFDMLSRSAVMFNCAKQDFISWALIDCLAYGCTPILPNYLTFPDVMGGSSAHLYTPNVVDAAVLAIRKALIRSDAPAQVDILPPLWLKYGQKYERVAARMLDIMYAAPTMEQEIAAAYNQK